MLRRREKTSADSLRGKQPTSTSSWDFQPPDWETRTVCFKQPGLWCLVRAPGHQQGVRGSRTAMLRQQTGRGRGGGRAAQEDEGSSYLAIFCRESRQPWGLLPIFEASCSPSPGNKVFQVPGTHEAS